MWVLRERGGSSSMYITDKKIFESYKDAYRTMQDRFEYLITHPPEEAVSASDIRDYYAGDVQYNKSRNYRFIDYGWGRWFISLSISKQ